MKKMVLILCVLALLAGTAIAGNFGKETTGSSTNLSIESNMAGGVFVAPEDGTVDSLYAHINASAATYVRGAIYEYATSANMTFVDSTYVRTISGAVNDFVDLEFVNKASITAGVKYALLVNGPIYAGTSYMGYDNSTGDASDTLLYDGFVWTSAWLEPYPWVYSQYDSKEAAIYCKYDLPASGNKRRRTMRR